MSRHALALAALTLALVAGACDDEPEPRIADPTSEAASESPSSEPPTTSEPPEPEPVRLSPEDTVRAWLAALDSAVLEGEFADIDRLSGTDCSTCEQFIKPIRDTYGAGGKYRTEATRVTALKAKPKQPQVVDAAIVIPAGVLIEAAGAEPTPFEETREILEFRVDDGAGGQSVISSVVFLS